MERMAVVDIGSNAIRLAFGNKGLINESQVERFPLRLGQDSFVKGRLSQRTINQFIQVLSNIQKQIKLKSIKQTRFVATSAIRDAHNKDQILEQIYDKLGIDLELISGVSEAKLIFKAIKKYYSPPPLKQSLIMDIGGGSVELITYKNKKIKPISLKIGTVRLLSFSKSNIAIWEKKINLQLSKNKENLSIINKNYNFIGTGGNVKSLGKLAYYTGISKRVDQLSISSISTLLTVLESMTYRQRMNLLGLRADRADVILPAVLLIHTLMSNFKFQYIKIPKVGLRNGLFL